LIHCWDRQSESGGDVLVGGTGNDIYVVDNTADLVDERGGNGSDLVQASVTFNLSNAARVFGALENLTLTGGAAINGAGNNSANIITGNNANNMLNGGIGNDILRGLNGSDSLTGGVGIDTLAGGAQNDFFVFNAPLNLANRDVITDFGNVAGNNDTFRLENAVMTKVGGLGALKPTAFFVGPAAHDTDDRIVYNKVNGALYYDSNGNLAGGATLLAVVSSKPTLTAADFLVI
jgi:Ca2+-binding RTX toxin-like protein